MSVGNEYADQLLEEIKDLSSEKIKEVLDFACFIKAKETIDPSQAYFWSRRWQQMEKEADEDRKAGRTIGDGTVEDLVQELKR